MAIKMNLVRDPIDVSGVEFEEKVLNIKRYAKVMKGGRVFSFGALTVIGDGQGLVGWGYGKAREVPDAIAKGLHSARRNLLRVPMDGTTVPHEVRGHYAASTVVILPAAPGTGIIAGSVVRAAVEAAGYRDVLTKSLGGNNNPRNLVRAAFDAFTQLRSREAQMKLRKGL